MKSTRDKNNFISIILNKIALAKNFHQRCAFTLTEKRILNHITLKFYIRRRYNDLYLYIRMSKHNFGSIVECHKFFIDIYNLFPQLYLESTQGHYKGWLLKINQDTEDTLISLLKLISLLSRPKDFYVKDTKLFKSYVNYRHTSSIPVHLRFTQVKLLDLRCYDLIKTLYTEVKEYDKKSDIITSNNIDSSN